MNLSFLTCKLRVPCVSQIITKNKNFPLNQNLQTMVFM